MFIQRLITGLLLTLLVVLAIFWLPYYWFVVLLTAIILFAAWEWSLLISCHDHKYCRWIYVICIALTMLLTWHLPIRWVLIPTLLWWGIAFYLIVQYPHVANLWSRGKIIRGCMGIAVLVPCWLALNTIRIAQDGSATLLYLLFMVWAADSGAYFAGRLWGKHLLLPRVSPKKTWQGVYGGVILTVVIAFIGCLLLHIPPSRWIFFLILGVVLAIFAIIGDLFESMLKRQVGIKDIARYLPGHGGLLDRIDSLTAAAPIFLLGLILFKL